MGLLCHPGCSLAQSARWQRSSSTGGKLFIAWHLQPPGEVAFAFGGMELVDVFSVDTKTSQAKPFLPNLQAVEVGFSPDGQLAGRASEYEMGPEVRRTG
jgi:hypothetical protein